MPFIIVASISALFGLVLLIDKKTNIKLAKIMKVLAITLFLIYILRLFQVDEIDKTYKLTKFLISKEAPNIPNAQYPGEPNYTWGDPLFSGVAVFFLMFLRWFTVVIVAVGIISPFVSSKIFKNILSFIGCLVCLLNIIFFYPNIKAFVGKDYEQSYYKLRMIQFAVEIVFVSLICLTNLFAKIKEHDFSGIKKQIGLMILTFICILPAFFPQGMLQVFFGELGEMTKGFTVSHRITMYITFALMIGLYAFFRGKSIETKRLFFVTVALAGFFQYFYNKTFDMGLTGLPLHLCNTAIIMMFFAFIFKLDGVFYFAYFVNVLGAFCAIALPNMEVDAFSEGSVVFWFNHIYAFILPILGVALKVWKRPNMKMMLKAMFIFTLYFVSVAFFNAWFNGIFLKEYGNLDTKSVDYFFIYGDFLNEKFKFLTPIQHENIASFTINGIRFIFFWKYQIIIYVAFIALMFVIWYVYDIFFKIADSHYDLLLRLKKQKMDVLNIQKERAKDMEQKINPTFDNIVEIKHFSKVYGSSKNKSVDDFNLTIKAGEVFGFLGHNGAGKSTTIKSMVGIQSITSGSIKICGYDISTNPLEAKLNIGYVSDNHAVYEKLTGREYVNYVADLYMVSKEDREERLAKYLKMFELEDAFDREIKSYSHGMKQKIVVISSLIHNPKVWVLDEPLTGLDPSSSYQIKECMREHANNGNVVFFSSHVIEIVEKICDKIVIIANGKRKGIFDMQSLRDNNISLEKLYLKYVYKNSDDREITMNDLLLEFKK